MFRLAVLCSRFATLRSAVQPAPSLLLRVRVRTRTLVLLRTPHSSDSRHGYFCGYVIPSTRLLALAWRVYSPPSSGRLWSQFAVCLPDVVYCVVGSLPPLQVVHGVQEQASRLGMVELPVDPGVCIEIWDELTRERNNFHLTFEAERCTQDGLARKHPQQQWTRKRVPA